MAQHPFLTRRALRPALALLALPLALLGACSTTAPTAAAACSADELVYVGNDAGKIEALRLDACAGKLAKIGDVADIAKPRWSLANPGKPVLYVAANPTQGKNGAIVAYAVNRANGALTKLDDVDSGGLDTTHLWLDGPSQTLLAAHFMSGAVTSFPINADGSVGAAVSTARETGSGPHKRQTKAHAHGIAMDDSGRWVLVTDLGADRIFIDGFDRATRTVTADDPAHPRAYVAPPGSGPHHAVFSHDGRFVYLLNELTATVQVLRWDAAQASLAPVQTFAISSPEFAGAKSGAEIIAGADGRFVYVLDRGEARLVVYSVDAQTGQLTLVQRVPSGGDKPWDFAIHPSGKWVLVANSNKVDLMRIDPMSGQLSATDQSVPSQTPLSLTFMP